ncbi:regulatory LuxR family protein [Scopulibacillus darangshiensis]|uniref:Regulatory LuxR family protein n=1 Tax=Scopulibacillus darangshiensis TaxID=442528 RepID=A0A4R2NGF7_9BACL|nr:response regulator transcription factor [Scopulibacillus darangshiensis]TCP20302.1 regulatory LuxR family protein [Scopulibacillus darangshiensis]
MSVSLNQRMKLILENGLHIVRLHKNEIFSEWNKMLDHLQQRKNKAAEEVNMAISIFTKTLVTDDNHDNVEHLFAGIQELRLQLKTLTLPRHSIFVITLLENAVHKAIKGNISDSYKNHQAVQYLFTQISEQLVVGPVNENLDLTDFLDQLVRSRQLPIVWVARVNQSIDSYITKDIIMSSEKAIFPDTKKLQSHSLFNLSELLLQEVPRVDEDSQQVFTLPWHDETLIFCTNQSESPYFLPFIAFSLQFLSIGNHAVQFIQQELQWKDAVILFNEWIMRSRNLKEAIENITSGFVNYLPFKRCALFSYSNTDQSGFGLFGHQFNSEEIQNIKENIDNIPLIYKNLKKLQPLEKNLKNLQPIYAFEASQGLPEQYVKQFQLESVVIAPIYVPSASKLLGAAILDQGPGNHFKVSFETLTALTRFGQSAGDLLEKFTFDRPRQPKIHHSSFHLSPREIEVLKLMADGASTSEAAEQMNLSEYTVRDYVSSILQKMKANNRTEAAAKAIRNGII